MILRLSKEQLPPVGCFDELIEFTHFLILENQLSKVLTDPGRLSF